MPKKIREIEKKYLKLAKQDYEDLNRDYDIILYLAELLQKTATSTIEIKELKKRLKEVDKNEWYRNG